jgi:hypothetical protein
MFATFFILPKIAYKGNYFLGPKQPNSLRYSQFSAKTLSSKPEGGYYGVDDWGSKRYKFITKVEVSVGKHADLTLILSAAGRINPSIHPPHQHLLTLPSKLIGLHGGPRHISRLNEIDLRHRDREKIESHILILFGLPAGQLRLLLGPLLLLLLELIISSALGLPLAHLLLAAGHIVLSYFLYLLRLHLIIFLIFFMRKRKF